MSLCDLSPEQYDRQESYVQDVGLDHVLPAWEEIPPAPDGPEYADWADDRRTI